MITTEIINIDGKDFQKTQSDTYFIEQIETKVLYEYAIDVIPCKYTYIESDKFLPVEEGLPAEKELEIVNDLDEIKK